MAKLAVLTLADKSLFRGIAIGADGETNGEIVFNTSMTGYQEILTDPSYSRQIITLTYPHIGNTGITPQDEESSKIHAAGLIIRDLPLLASNWRNNMPLDEYLRLNGIVAIANIDTRRLTRILRETGAQNGCIMIADESGKIDEEVALEKARSCPGMKNIDLVQEVTTTASYDWKESVWSVETNDHQVVAEQPFHVVAYDFGIKRNILRMLAQRGCRLTIVPAKKPANEVLAMNPDGVFLSNGPGDPAACVYGIKAIQEILATNIPIFGVCLGHQLLSLASGACTMKMKFGHHSTNHPVQNLATGMVMITSQNHGFVVSEENLPDHIRVTHKSLFDGSLQGIELIGKPAFSFQGHPEASPGPHDMAVLFDRFISMIKAYYENKNAETYRY